MNYVAISSKELKLIFYVSVLGTIIDTSLILTNLLAYKGNYMNNSLIAPIWITSMWAGFATTINHSMAWLKNKYVAGMLLGSIFGPLAYMTGQNLGVIYFVSSYEISITALAILWGLAMPTIYLINEKLVINE